MIFITQYMYCYIMTSVFHTFSVHVDLLKFCNKSFFFLLPPYEQDTGKFELVHELSRSLGYPLYRFNCTKTMNYEQLQDIFRGMAATGRCIHNEEIEREREKYFYMNMKS